MKRAHNVSQYYKQIKCQMCCSVKMAEAPWHYVSQRASACGIELVIALFLEC